MKTNIIIPGIFFFEVLLFWGISSSRVLAQNQYDSSADSMLRPSIIKTNPVRLILDEVQVFYEVPKNHHKSIEWKMGIIYPQIEMKGVGAFFSSTFFHHWGILVGIGLRKYKQPEKTNQFRFFQFGSTLKLSYMPKQSHCGDGCGLSGSTIYMDQQLYSLNFQVKWGNQWYQKNNKLVHELYYGFGFTVNYAHSNYYSELYYDKPHFDQGWFIYPTIHMGYKIGWQLKKKYK